MVTIQSEVMGSVGGFILDHGGGIIDQRARHFRPVGLVWTRDMGYILTRDMGDVDKGHG